MKQLAGIVMAVFILLSACMTGCSQAGLRVISEENPPYNFTDETGNITGQSTEIVRQIVNKTGSQVAIEILPWTQGYSIVQKEPNTVLYSTSRIPQREGLFKWVGPIGSADNWFYSKLGADFAIATLDDAKKVKSIAVYKDDSNQIFLQGQGFTNLDICQDATECIKKLVDGKVDLWLGPAEGLEFIAYGAGINPAEIEAVKFVRRADWYIAFNKETPDSTIQAWQQALDDLKKGGDAGKMCVYEDIVTSYALPRYTTGSVPKEDVIKLTQQTAADIGKDAAGTIALINTGASPYRNAHNRALYVYVFDKYVTIVANADNAAVIGRNFIGVPDMAGKLFRDAIVDHALMNGSGWEDYVFTLPGKIGLYYKTAYYKLVTGSDGKQYIVCAGRYKEKGD
jgi:polar amino acid transport system substrate-binding protein